MVLDTVIALIIVVLLGGLGETSGGPMEIVMTNGFFIVLFVAAAWLFRHAARDGAGSA